MASNNTTLLETQKRRNSNIAFALRHRSTHKKYSGRNSPVNFRQGLEKNKVSARKLAAGLWQLRFVELSGDCGDASFRSSKSKVCVYLNVIVSHSNNCCKLRLMLQTLTHRDT